MHRHSLLTSLFALLISSLVFEAAAAKIKHGRPLKPFNLTYDISNFSATKLGIACNPAAVGDIFAQHFVDYIRPDFVKACGPGLAPFLKNFYYSPALRTRSGLTATCTVTMKNGEEASVSFFAVDFSSTEAFVLATAALTVTERLLKTFESSLAILIEDYYSEHHKLPPFKRILFSTEMSPPRCFLPRSY